MDDDLLELDRARQRGLQTYAAPEDGGLQEEDRGGRGCGGPSKNRPNSKIVRGETDSGLEGLKQSLTPTPNQSDRWGGIPKTPHLLIGRGLYLHETDGPNYLDDLGWVSGYSTKCTFEDFAGSSIFWESRLEMVRIAEAF